MNTVRNFLVVLLVSVFLLPVNAIESVFDDMDEKVVYEYKAYLAKGGTVNELLETYHPDIYKLPIAQRIEHKEVLVDHLLEDSAKRKGLIKFYHLIDHLLDVAIAKLMEFDYEHYQELQDENDNEQGFIGGVIVPGLVPMIEPGVHIGGPWGYNPDPADEYINGGYTPPAYTPPATSPNPVDDGKTLDDFFPPLPPEKGPVLGEPPPQPPEPSPPTTSPPTKTGPDFVGGILPGVIIEPGVYWGPFGPGYQNPGATGGDNNHGYGRPDGNYGNQGI